MAAGLEIKNALLQTSLIGIVNFAFAFFAACIGPAFWTLVAEMFPNKIRGTAIAMISFTQWTLNFIVVLLFPHLLKAIGGSMTFLFLAVMSAGQLLIAWFFIKETKGKTLEEIEKMWVE